jgi:hypothetical protein
MTFSSIGHLELWAGHDDIAIVEHANCEICRVAHA